MATTMNKRQVNERQRIVPHAQAVATSAPSSSVATDPDTLPRRVGSLTLLAASCIVFAGCPVSREEAEPQPHFHVSKDTTWLTEPLTDDGYVDYSAAINAINSVPHAANAAALLIELAGVPEYWEDTQREKLQVALGLPAFPAKRGELNSELDYMRYLERRDLPVPEDEQRLDQWSLTSSRPWSAHEAPYIQGLLEFHSKQLATLDAILAKPSYFEPMIPGRERTVTIVPVSCEIAKRARWYLGDLLVRRSFLHLGEGRFENAIDDLMRMHRLARLGQKTRLMFGLIDNTHLERRALTGGVQMLELADLDEKSLRKYLHAIQRLEPCLRAQDVCLFHRLSHLASATVCERDSPQSFIGNVQAFEELLIDTLTAAETDERSEEPTTEPYWCRVTSDQVDWDYLLNSINRRYDQAERIHTMPSTVERLRAIRDFVEDTQQRKPNFADRAQFETARAQSETEARRRLTDDIGVVLDCMLNNEHISTYEELSLRARLDLLRIMTAVRLHEKLHGALPETLHEIVAYFDKTLLDPFSEKPYRAKPLSHGWEVSSAGCDDEELPRAYRELRVTIHARDREANPPTPHAQ